MKQSISELNLLTGLDRRRINRALADLKPTPGPKGAQLYESTEALPLLYLQPGENDSFDLTAERARLAHHQANAAGLQERKLRGELIEIEECADIIGQDYANVRARLLAIPSRAAPELLGLCTTAIRARLDDLVREVLEELSADETYSAGSQPESRNPEI